MRLGKLLKELQEVFDKEGDIETTCTGSTLPDGHGGPIPDVFESTVEHLAVGEHPTIGKKVRLYM